MTTRRQFLGTLLALAASARRGFAQRARVQRARVRTVAGTGIAGYQPEGSLGADALSSPIDNPYGVIVGADDAMYFCEVDTGRTRRVELATNRLTTIAGTGEETYAGDGGPALAAAFSAPHEIRFDSDGNLYVVERDAHVVRRIDRRTGLVSTLAGTGEAGFSGDGGPADRAQLRQPHSIAFDSTGELLICDIGNSRVRAVDMTTGTIRTYAGTGDRTPTPLEAPLQGTPLQGPRSLDTDSEGNVYLVLREGNAVYRLDRGAGRMVRIAGSGETGFTGDGGPALQATFNGPKGIAYSASDHSLYIVDTENHAIRRMDLASGILSTVLGTGERGDGPDGDPLGCRLARPHGVFMHRDVLYVTDSENHRIRGLELLG
jgi:sugar lactone lactonase YvrE